MLQNKLRWIAISLTLGIIFSACAGTPPLTTVNTPEATTSLAFDPSDGSLLKAAATGLFRLESNGQTWEAIKTPAATGLTGLAINPDDAQTLYVSGPGVGVLKSADSGQSWSQVNNGLPSTDIAALAMHSLFRETLYAWVQGDGIYRTEDGGANWKRMPDQGPPDKAVYGLAHSTLPGSMNTGWLYATTSSGAYLSMDCF